MPEGIADVAVEPLVLDISVDDIVEDVSLTAVSVVTFVFSSFLQPKANSEIATTIRTASDFFIVFNYPFFDFFVVVFVDVEVVAVVPVVPVIAVPDVSVPVIAVPDVSVMDVPVMTVPDVSVMDVLLIAVPEVSLVVIVEEVSLTAVSVTFVFSSFLHANAKRARAITMRMARLLFITSSFQCWGWSTEGM